jgi:T6SS, Phospholipase effector Tle1-like, catalytic domain
MTAAKNIVIYSDGTGQDGGVRPEQRVSNVYKMYRASRVAPETAIDPREQVTFYDPGLGTDIGATALTAPVRFIQKLLASVTGRGIATNIADCYEFIINHYQRGDRIFLIGFSRGAYTIRSVANLLMLCGVPTNGRFGPLIRFRKEVRDIAEEAITTVFEHGAGHPRADFEDERNELARRFRSKYGSHHPSEPGESNVAPYFIGVFDTVAALGARGMRRFLIHAGLGIAVTLTSALVLVPPALLVAALLEWLVGTPFWWTGFGLLLAGVIATNIWWWRRQKASIRKTVTSQIRKTSAHIKPSGRPRISIASSAATSITPGQPTQSTKRGRISTVSPGAAFKRACPRSSPATSG